MIKCEKTNNSNFIAKLKYMKTTTYIILIILLTVWDGFSKGIETEKPDYKKIGKEISKESSDYYYPKLMEKFKNADTTMTLEEKRHLYYGYTFQEQYAPYEDPDYVDSLKVVLQKEQHGPADLNKIVVFSDSILSENPFDLSILSYQLYALEGLKDLILFDKKMAQATIIIDALLSSGDGRTQKTAFYVIETSHEYELLGILGLQFGGQQSLIEHYDYLEVAENQFGIEGLYFDVSPCLNSLKDMFK